MSSEKIETAIEEGSRLYIVYKGGTQPGTVREIAPNHYDKEAGKFLAWCYNTDSICSFFDDMVQIIESSEIDKYPKTQKPQKPKEFKCLEDAFEYYKDTFESIGWDVTYTERPECIELREHFKNGKIKRTPVISLSFLYCIGEDVINSSFDIPEGERYSLSRPWCLRAKGLKTKNYGNLSNAVLNLAQVVGESEPQGSLEAKPQGVVQTQTQGWEIKLIESIVQNRRDSGKQFFDRLNEQLIVPNVLYSPENRQGSLNNSYWHYDVGYAFRDALDIKYLERVKKKKKINLWTQGPNIAFKEGDLLRSNQNDPVLQVKFATPMGWDADKDEMYYGSITYIKLDDDTQHICNQLDFLKIMIYGINHSGV